MVLFLVELLLVVINYSYSEKLTKLQIDKYNRHLYLDDPTFQCESLQVARACNLSKMLTSLLDGYDNRIRPFEGGEDPIHVDVGIRIFNLYKINEVNMDYRLDLDLVQHWKDPRLSSSSTEDLFVPKSMVNKIWLPDTYFLNSKHASYHKVTTPNSLLLLKPDGSLMYSSRITLRASCSMDFHMYPADTQECHLQIESFGYPSNELFYHWNSSRKWSESLGVTQVPQFHIADFKLAERVREYPLGTWSTLKATFIIKRNLGYFFLHLYCPCFMVVGLSWVSFFIPKDGVGARIRLSMIATLNITTILNLLNKVLPQVSYIKLVDWYLIISFIFVFGVFIEYTTILWLTDSEKKRADKQNEKAKLKKDEETYESVQNSQHDVGENADTIRQDIPHTSKRESPINIGKVHGEEIKGVEEKIGQSGKDTIDDEDKESQSVAHTPEVYFLCRFRLELIDNTSKILFPVSYITFNIIYWFYFFSNKDNTSKDH